MTNTKILFKKKRKAIKGFTLVELLVVISIIGVLATLVLVSFTGIQKQARDAERKSDLKQYQTALESFANKNNGLYPSRTYGSGIQASETLCNDLGITTCPEDPKYTDGSDGFIYKYQSDGTGNGHTDATQYILWDKLKRETDYWVVCSNGRSALIDASTTFSNGECPF